jgi:hypothetical protein
VIILLPFTDAKTIWYGIVNTSFHSRISGFGSIQISCCNDHPYWDIESIINYLNPYLIRHPLVLKFRALRQFSQSCLDNMTFALRTFVDSSLF